MKPALPPSETHVGTNLLGFFAALLAMYLLKDSGLRTLDMTLVILAIAVTPVLLIEFFIFKRHREPRAGLLDKRPANHTRVFIKCLGLLGIFGIFTTLYTCIPEYDAPFYNAVWPFYAALAPLLIIAAPFYFTWCDARQNDPEDGYYHLGRLMLFNTSGIDRASIIRLLRNWLVKAFFLPLMLTYTMISVRELQLFEAHEKLEFVTWVMFSQGVVMFGDLLYATLGYIFTLRIFNAHIRSSEPTFLGWFVAVACYYPFWHLLLFPHFFNYGEQSWQTIIPHGIWQYIWGGAIVLFLAIYSLSTICLGVRFSNLTYRGLVTNGPYRFTKHPAYVAKNIAWWLGSLPFITYGSTYLAISQTCAMIGVNALYYLRARTEENHLSNYPEYVEYALAMNERSIFAPLANKLTFLKYKVPGILPKI